MVSPTSEANISVESGVGELIVDVHCICIDSGYVHGLQRHTGEGQANTNGVGAAHVNNR